MAPTSRDVPGSVATAVVALALVSIADLAAAILRIGSGGWRGWPFLDATLLVVMLSLLRRRHPLVWTGLRVYGITAVVMGALELVSRTALFRWHGGITVVLASVGLVAIARPSARAYFSPS